MSWPADLVRVQLSMRRARYLLVPGVFACTLVLARIERANRDMPARIHTARDSSALMIAGAFSFAFWFDEREWISAAAKGVQVMWACIVASASIIYWLLCQI